MASRPDWDEWALGIAHAVAKRGDCTRRQVGCVILNPDHRIVSVGYNGAPSGAPGCLSDGACLRGQHYRVGYSHCVPGCDSPRHANDTSMCACGSDWPCPDAVAPGSSYDTGPGACISVHAEANALLWAGRDKLKGAKLYVTEAPCDGCMKLIMATPIVAVVTAPGEGGRMWLNG